jgi:hypothetical protein
MCMCLGSLQLAYVRGQTIMQHAYTYEKLGFFFASHTRTHYNLQLHSLLSPTVQSDPQPITTHSISPIAYSCFSTIQYECYSNMCKQTLYYSHHINTESKYFFSLYQPNTNHMKTTYQEFPRHSPHNNQ